MHLKNGIIGKSIGKHVQSYNTAIIELQRKTYRNSGGTSNHRKDMNDGSLSSRDDL